ncbi:hypothetical protein MASR2M18_08170 [Ignavibacteria bacterium]
MITLNEFAGEKHVYLLSAGIAFNTLLCALPLLLTATSIVGILWNENSASEAIRQMLTDFLPSTHSSAEFIESILTEVRAAFEFSSIAGYIGAATLIWTASALASSIRNALNVVFSLPAPHFFLLYKLKDLGITISFSLLLILTSAIAPVIAFTSSLGAKVMPPLFAEWFGGTTVNLVATAGTFLTMYLLYGYLPNAKLPWRLRLRSAVSGAFLLEAARFIFGWYLTKATSFGKIYGVYATLIAIAIWVYYASLIIVMSAVTSLAAERYGGFRAIFRGGHTQSNQT